MDLKKKHTIILLPSYQPEQTLIKLSKALHQHGFSILIIDDGSGEDYQYIFDECKNWSTVLVHHKNLGKGAAIKTGYKHIVKTCTKVEYVITADGDGQHTIQDIIKVFDKLVDKHISVIGERHFDGKVPIKSKLGNGLSRFTQALCTFRYMKDNQCGLRGFPIALIEPMSKIRGNRYEYEMRVLNWFHMKEIPYVPILVQTIYEDNNSKSHFRPIKDTFLIQSSIILCGLVNLIAIAFNVVLAFILFEYVFKAGAIHETSVPYELAVLTASPLTLLFQFFLMLIIFKPKNLGKMSLRLILYYLLLLVSEIISVELFTRICNLPLYGSLLITFPLMLIPIFYLIKGIGIVYCSQNE